jgi:F-type H+-transporting ATPase subunit b
MQIISNIALISINETLVFQVISFLVFLFIINRIMFRPLRSVMKERETYIENIQKDIVAAEKRYEDLSYQIRQQEKAVKNEAFEQKESLERSGSRQAAEIFDATRKEINSLKHENQKKIDLQISAARKHVQKESEDLAKDIIEKLLHRSLKS